MKKYFLLVLFAMFVFTGTANANIRFINDTGEDDKFYVPEADAGGNVKCPDEFKECAKNMHGLGTRCLGKFRACACDDPFKYKCDGSNQSGVGELCDNTYYKACKCPNGWVKSCDAPKEIVGKACIDTAGDVYGESCKCPASFKECSTGQIGVGPACDGIKYASCKCDPSKFVNCYYGGASGAASCAGENGAQLFTKCKGKCDDFVKCQSPMLGSGEACSEDGNTKYKGCKCPDGWAVCNPNRGVGSPCNGRYSSCMPDPIPEPEPTPTPPAAVDPISGVPLQTKCNTSSYEAITVGGVKGYKVSGRAIYEWHNYVNRGNCESVCSGIGWRLPTLAEVREFSPFIKACGWERCDVYWSQGDPTAREWVDGIVRPCPGWAGYADTGNNCMCIKDL